MNMVGNIYKSSEDQPKTYTLLGADNITYVSEAPGLLGGNSKSKIYGRFDCSAAIRAIKIGGYEKSKGQASLQQLIGYRKRIRNVFF
jgi:hypothetical protein